MKHLLIHAGKYRKYRWNWAKKHEQIAEVPNSIRDLDTPFVTCFFEFFHRFRKLQRISRLHLRANGNRALNSLFEKGEILVGGGVLAIFTNLVIFGNGWKAVKIAVRGI